MRGLRKRGGAGLRRGTMSAHVLLPRRTGWILAGGMLLTLAGASGSMRAGPLCRCSASNLLGFATGGVAPAGPRCRTQCARTAGRPQHVLSPQPCALGLSGLRRQGARRAMMSDGSLAGSGAAGGEDGAVPADIRAHKSWFRVIWDFSRPHTIIGSVLSVLSLHLFAVMAPGAAAVNLSALFVAMSWAVGCAIFINIFVTGLNQITDVDIDKINKPYLPIAAGYLSVPVAWAVCLAALFLGTVPSILAYPFDKGPLLAVTIGSALLGTAYSLPPLRLKRFPVFAALCIIVVRGTLVNLGFYAHAAHALGGALLPARACVAALFFGLFGW